MALVETLLKQICFVCYLFVWQLVSHHMWLLLLWETLSAMWVLTAFAVVQPWREVAATIALQKERCWTSVTGLCCCCCCCCCWCCCCCAADQQQQQATTMCIRIASDTLLIHFWYTFQQNCISRDTLLIHFPLKLYHHRQTLWYTFIRFPSTQYLNYYLLDVVCCLQHSSDNTFVLLLAV